MKNYQIGIDISKEKVNICIKSGKKDIWDWGDDDDDNDDDNDNDDNERGDGEENVMGNVGSSSGDEN